MIKDRKSERKGDRIKSLEKKIQKMAILILKKLS